MNGTQNFQNEGHDELLLGAPPLIKARAILSEWNTPLST
jgi:hypothetical protein